MHGAAISLQATLVFRLLRYARNDKKQDGRAAQVPFAMTSHLMFAMTTLISFIITILN